MVREEVPANKLAVHLHDMYGQALVNILVALQEEFFLRVKNFWG